MRNTSFLLVLLLLSWICATAESSSADIYTIDLKTGNLTQVTNISDANEFNPSFSPTGKFMVYDVVGDPAPQGHAIYMTNLKTGASEFLSGCEGGNDAAFSPDGKLIAFDRSPVGDATIYLVTFPGGTPILFRTDSVDADWSNTGRSIVFQQFSDGSIRTRNVSTGEETVVVSQGINPSWSPDGQAIVYSDGGDLWKIEMAQGSPVGSPIQLTSDPAYEGQPTWSSDGKMIAYHANYGSDFDIWAIPEDGGVPSKLIGPAGNDFDPGFSKIGRRLAFSGITP